MHKIKMTLCALGAAAIGLALVSTAPAQQPGRIRGTVEKVDGGMLVMKTRDGDTLNVKVAENARLAALVKAELADIKNDAFIGVAGIPQADGSIKAFSVHIFLPAQRGVVPDRGASRLRCPAIGLFRVKSRQCECSRLACVAWSGVLLEWRDFSGVDNSRRRGSAVDRCLRESHRDRRSAT